MGFIHSLSPLLGMLLASLPPVAVQAEEVAIERSGLYILADDIEELAGFYERLLARRPQVRTPTFISFDVAGGLFAVVSRRAYATDSVRGDIVRPFLKVADIDGAFARARTLFPDRVRGGAVVHEGGFAYFRLADPEGNVVEFFSFRPAAGQ